MLQADRTSYPGLRPAEGDVLRAWLRVHESEYDRFEYNVRVGKGAEPDPEFTPEAQRMVTLNSQLKIDSVAWKGGDATLIEVKERARPAVIGQLLVYRTLWLQQDASRRPPKLLVVTLDVPSDIKEIVLSSGIDIAIVPAPSQAFALPPVGTPY